MFLNLCLHSERFFETQQHIYTEEVLTLQVLRASLCRRNNKGYFVFSLNMGSNVSTHKTKTTSSTTNKKSVNGGGGGEHKEEEQQQQLPVSTHPNFGSKEEAFFDSQAWLDSDCDDDFRSVNGDFTPSRGSTSSNQGNSIKLPLQVDKYNFLDGTTDFKPESSPSDKKNRLSDLFQDGFAAEDLSDEQMNTTNTNLEPKQTILDCLSSSRKSTKEGSSPYVSSPSRYGHHLNADQKPTKSATCCLPGLMISRSFRERKNKPSPGLTVVGGG